MTTVREAAQAVVDAIEAWQGDTPRHPESDWAARLRAALAARPAPSGDADAEWTKAWLRAKADVLAAINRGPDRVAVEGLLDYHGPLLRAAAPSEGAGGHQHDFRFVGSLPGKTCIECGAAEPTP